MRPGTDAGDTLDTNNASRGRLVGRGADANVQRRIVGVGLDSVIVRDLAVWNTPSPGTALAGDTGCAIVPAPLPAELDAIGHASFGGGREP